MAAAETTKDPGLSDLLLGYLLLGLQPVPVSLLALAGIASAEAVFIRFSFGVLAVGVICLARGRSLKTKQPLTLALRGLLGGTAVLLYFYSIQHAGAARGTLLNYTYPVWANLFAFALGTRPPPRFWLGLAAALLGVWFVVVPRAGLSGGGIGAGELAGIASSIFAGAAVLTIKRLRKTDESLTIIAAFSVIGLIMAAPFMEFGSLMLLSHGKVGLLALAVCLLSFLGHIFFTRGYRGVTVAQATLLSLLVPVIGTLAGIFFLDEQASSRFFGGALLVLSASGLVLGADARAKLESQSSSNAT